MPISQQIGSSSLAKPGVCTSTTRPATPYQGQVIYQTDTNTTLVWNGSGWVLLSTGTANPPGLEFITSKSWTTGGTVSVDSCFTSTYSAYRIVARNMKHATTEVNVLLRLRAGGADTTTGYYWGLNAVTFAGVGNASGLSNDTSIRTGTANASIAGAMVIDIIDPQKANQTSVTFQGSYANTSTGETRNGSAFVNNTTQYDGFSLIANSGNFAALEVRVYGYKD